MSESRFGWNLVNLDRWDAFFRVMDPNPNAPPEVSAFAQRVPFININNLFSGPDAEIFNLHNHTWSYDQKVSRGIDRHLLKLGFRWMRRSGNKLSPRIRSSSMRRWLMRWRTSRCRSTRRSGRPTTTPIDELGGFVQDDWRLGRISSSTWACASTTTRDRREAYHRRARGNREPFSGDGPPQTGFWSAARPAAVRMTRALPRRAATGLCMDRPGSNRPWSEEASGYLFSPHMQATVRQIMASPTSGSANLE